MQITFTYRRPVGYAEPVRKFRINEIRCIVRNHVENKSLGANLLIDTFTMKDLQKLHETILKEKLHRTGFHRKMMDSGHLERLGKKKTGKAHHSPYLYKFIAEDE